MKVISVSEAGFLDELEEIIRERTVHPRPGSYIAGIMNDPKGIDKVLEKVGEETTEFIIAVKNGDPHRTVEESADLVFHFLLALRAAGIDMDAVIEELKKRKK